VAITVSVANVPWCSPAKAALFEQAVSDVTFRDAPSESRREKSCLCSALPASTSVEAGFLQKPLVYQGGVPLGQFENNWYTGAVGAWSALGDAPYLGLPSLEKCSS